MIPLALLAGILGLAFAWLEWRRPSRAYRPARVGATFAAAAALAALALTPAAPPAISPLSKAALWTSGAGAETASAGLPVFALPGAEPIPAGAMRVPDVGVLRRLHPRLEALEIFGDGVDAAEAPRLRGLRVALHPAPAREPRFAQIEVPRSVPVGGELELRGRVEGPIPADAVVSWEGPDGTVVPAILTDGRFTVRSGPLASAGRVLGKLALRSGERELAREVVGVPVVPPALPRVLVLETSPRLDTARLKRWLEPLGGALAVRTQIGRQRSRDAALAGARADFAELNAGVLARFDLVVADAKALGALSTAEREALLAAVRGPGLGLLLLDPAPDSGELAPWRLAPVAGLEPGSTERLMRPRGIDRPFPAREPIPALPAEIQLAAGQRPLLRDSQDRVLAATMALGRGQLALTLLRETWRWGQADEPATFAEYWSRLFAAVARRDAAGAWSIEAAGGGPPVVHQPLTLRWRGPVDSMPRTGLVHSSTGETVPVPFAADPGLSGSWAGKFWPTSQGWHRLSDGAGPGTDFFVAGGDDWRGVRAALRRDATMRLTLEAPAAGPQDAEVAASPLRGWLAALLIAALSFLWIESRWKPGAVDR